MPTFSFKEGSAAVVSRGQLQQYEDWRNAFRDCCKDHRFYEIIEDTLANDFEYQYLILRDLDGSVRGIQRQIDINTLGRLAHREDGQAVGDF